MTRESVRDAVMGAIMMMILMSIGQQMGPEHQQACLLYTSPSPRDRSVSRMPSSA